MARADKESAVAELAERFRSSSGVVLTEYRGLTVSQLGELRKTLDGNAQFSVVKNTLTKIAAGQAGVTAELADLLEGPSAIAFVGGDVVEAAKGLRDFSRNYPLLVIKGGVLDGKPLTPAEIVRLADLEPREVLLAKLAGAMKASLAGAAATFNALPAQMARLLAALEEKKRAEGGAAADAPAATGEATAETAEVPAETAETAEAPAETAETTAEAPAETAESPAEPTAVAEES
jgi:large subunit ribosomal protein L10